MVYLKIIMTLKDENALLIRVFSLIGANHLSNAKGIAVYAYIKKKHVY